MTKDMQLDQFDKLEQNIKKIVDFVFKLKIENHKLKNEVESLQKQLENFSDENIQYLNKKEEIEQGKESFPIERKEYVVSQLDKILQNLKNLSTGVEFK
ncbi:hypothetical protein ACFLSX_01975 [Calditrichota bacterium]